MPPDVIREMNLDDYLALQREYLGFFSKGALGTEALEAAMTVVAHAVHTPTTVLDIGIDVLFRWEALAVQLLKHLRHR